MTSQLAAEVANVAEGTAIGFYLVYATLAVGLVVYLARTLRTNGAVFLVDVFDDDNLAHSVNHLLVVGFYLLNLGYAFLLFQLQPSYATLTEAFNQLTVKIGWLLLSLGLIHLFNMFVFWRIRTHRDRRFVAPRGGPQGFRPPGPNPGPGPGGAPGGGPGAGPGPFPGPRPTPETPHTVTPGTMTPGTMTPGAVTPGAVPPRAMVRPR